MHCAESETAALYAPLTGGKHQSNFPLHCDLYGPKILWNIFGQVPKDGSGQSLFLKMENLFDILDSISTIPKAAIVRIRQLIYDNSGMDNFNEFYNILYNPNNPWQKLFEMALKKHQSKVLFGRGEGYMIHDRIWMHGRDHTSGGIGRKRLHRLIFDNNHA